MFFVRTGGGFSNEKRLKSNWKLNTFGARLYFRITLLEMAFLNGLCKLPMSTNIDESESPSKTR